MLGLSAEFVMKCPFVHCPSSCFVLAYLFSDDPSLVLLAASVNIFITSLLGNILLQNVLGQSSGSKLRKLSFFFPVIYNMLEAKFTSYCKAVFIYKAVL